MPNGQAAIPAANPRPDPVRPADDEARTLARALLREAASATLGTLAGDGFPFATLVGIATDTDAAPIVLVSRLSAHTRHLDADPRASLLLARSGKGDPLAHPRLTVQARAERLDPADERLARIRRRYLARQPKSALYVDFADFGFFRLAPLSGSLNGGFGRAHALEARDLLAEAGMADAIAALEEGALAHMNADHADALTLYADRLLGLGGGAWQAVGLDPHGLDLALGGQRGRLEFPEPVGDGGALRRMLASLADRARADSA